MKDLQIVEHAGERVLTTEQLAQVYECEPNNIKKNFKVNKDRFDEGKHYYLLEGDALKAFKDEVTISNLVGKNASHLILWTRRGASRHSKMLGTDKAWEMFDALEENYFNPRPKALTPAEQMAQGLLAAQKLLAEKDTTIAQQSQVIGELKPKADYTDEILRSKDAVPITNIAKDYGMSGKAMNAILHDLHVIYKLGGQWLLYSKYQSKGYTRSETTKYVRHDGTVGASMHTK